MRVIQSRRWTCTAIAGVVLAAGAGMAFLRHASRNSSEALRLYTITQSLANRLDASEWQAMAEGQVSEEMLREVQSIRADLGRLQGDLVHLGREEHQAWHVWERFQEYTEAVDREYEAVLAGNLAQARKIHKEQSDPAFARLDGVISVALTAYEERTRRLNRVDDWGTALILAMAGLIVWWMVEAIRKA